MVNRVKSDAPENTYIIRDSETHVKESFSSESGSFSNFLRHLKERQFFLGVYLVLIAFQAGACAPAFFVPFLRIGFRISSRVSAAAASAFWIAWL